MKVVWQRRDNRVLRGGRVLNLAAAWMQSVLLLTGSVALHVDASAAEPLVPPTAAPVAASAASAVPADGGRKVYVQRDAQGKAVYTDRPSAGLITERQWSLEPEDEASAAARREAGRLQSERVTERVQRTIDQQQQRLNELQIEQLRAQQAADALQAERLREREREEASRGVLLRPYGQPFGATPFGAGRPGPYRPDTSLPRPKPPGKPVPPPSPPAPPSESR